MRAYLTEPLAISGRTPAASHSSDKRADGKVLILGIDTFAAKNLAQVEALEKSGYHFTIATVDSRHDSDDHFKHLNPIRHAFHVLPGSLISRLITVIQLLRDGPYNHVELYAGGRFTLFYLPLLHHFKCCWIVVERGDIGSMQTHSKLTRLLVRWAYKAANAVWYKEPYMLPLLIKEGIRKLYFIPNAADTPTLPSGARDRDIDFLWANRFVNVRHPEWIVRIGSEPAFSDCMFAMLGIQSATHCDKATLRLQHYVTHHRPPNFEVRGFEDPFPWYDRARFFLLPARIVFGNNALLEAMARGVVPIVTRSPGIEELVQDGVNGLVAELDESSFKAAMEKAALMDDADWQAMSQAAADTIRSHYNLNLWTRRMVQMYEELA